MRYATPFDDDIELTVGCGHGKFHGAHNLNAPYIRLKMQLARLSSTEGLSNWVLPSQICKLSNLTDSQFTHAGVILVCELEIIMTAAIQENTEILPINTSNLETHDAISFANKNQISFEQAHDLIVRYGADTQKLEIETARIRGFVSQSK